MSRWGWRDRMMNDDWRLTGNPVRVSSKSALPGPRHPRPAFVILANARTHASGRRGLSAWVPAFAGMTTQGEPAVPLGEVGVVGADLAGT